MKTRTQIFLIASIILSVSILSFLDFSDSAPPIILSEKTIHNDKGLLIATEKTLSDKTHIQKTNNLISTKSGLNKITLDFQSFKDQSKVIDGLINVSLVSENPSKTCKLYLVNDYINSEAVTDGFPCTNQSVSLNQRGHHIFTAKINDGNADFKVVSSDGIEFETGDMPINITYKKFQYFAKIENNIVSNVIVADDEFISTQSGTWIETWIDAVDNPRKRHAGIGMTYNSTSDMFVEIKPFPSWILNYTDGSWYAPVPMPSDGKYYWDEDLQNWIKAVN